MKLTKVSLIASAVFSLCSVLWVSAPARAETITHGVYRPTTGEWFYHRTDGTGVSAQWGIPGDLPVPADFLGVGGPQIAVYRPSTGEWFIRNDDGTGVSIQWGIPGDVPMPGDYFGTGRAQIAVWRPSTRQWFVRKDDSTAGISEWGCSVDIPVLVKAAPVPAPAPAPPAVYTGNYWGSWNVVNPQNGGNIAEGSAAIQVAKDGSVSGSLNGYATLIGTLAAGKFILTLTFDDGTTVSATGTVSDPAGSSVGGFSGTGTIDGGDPFFFSLNP